MADSPPEFPLPPTGSFPGFRRGSDLFSAWSNAMLQQARIWNNVWTQMRGGNYELRHWYKAIVDSVDLGAATLEQFVQTLNGPAAPPWVGLSYPPDSDVEVRLRQPIDEQHGLRVSSLSLLGAATPSPSPLGGTAMMKGTYSLIVSVSATADADMVDGEYIGFVFSDRYAEPLAVLTVSVATP